MSQTIQVECPNCQAINNVLIDLPLSVDAGDITFDCGKCGEEVTLEVNLTYEFSTYDREEQEEE